MVFTEEICRDYLNYGFFGTGEYLKKGHFLQESEFQGIRSKVIF